MTDSGRFVAEPDPSGNGDGAVATGPEPEFRAVAESLAVPIWSARADGLVDYSNPQARADLGQPDDESPGWSWIERLHPGDVDRVLQNWIEAVGRGAEYEAELRVRVGEGRSRWLRVRGTPLRDAEGRLLRWYGSWTDIDDQRRAAETAEARRARLQSALRAANVGFWDWDVVTGQVTWSEECFGLYGLEPGRDTPSYEQWLACVHEDDRDDVRQVVADMIGRPSEHDFEFRIRHPRFGVRWLNSIGDTVCDAEGRPAKVTGITLDITPRKHAELALAESEARARARADELQVLMNAVPAAVWIAHDPECRTITGNAASYDLLRLPTGANASITAPEPERPTHFRAMRDGVEIPNSELPVQRAAARGEIVQGTEHDIVFDDGTVRHVLGNATPLFDDQGRPRGAVSVFMDITEKKIAEQALRESEARFAAVVEYSPTIIFAKDLEGRYVLVNRRFEQAVGCAADQIIGKTDADLFPATLIEKFRRDDQAVLDSAQPISYEESFEYRGETLTFLTAKFPLLSAEGKPTAVCGIAKDITSRKKAEEVLLLADRRKDEFLAMLAHELRNPLAAIRSGAHLLTRADATTDDREWAVQSIERQVGNLTHLIDDLLDVSRISKDKIQLKTRGLDAGEVLTHAVQTVRPFLDERRHRLEVAFTPGALPVVADPVRLEQIVVNLLTNAGKYTDAGGRIELSAAREGAQVVIKVKDNGTGVPPEKLTTMFELFAQGENTLDRSEGGLGIGLTLVKRLAEMHGGSVTATSEGPGLGSEFTVRLPAAERLADDSPARAPRPAPSARSGRRILVVDDNVASVRGLARLLQLNGHDVRTAYNGPDALDDARAHPPDVVLLDIGLPGMDGYQVARQLRATIIPHALLIAVSGYGQDDDLRRSQEAGCDTHLVKPVDLDALLTLVSRTESGRARR